MRAISTRCRNMLAALQVLLVVQPIAAEPAHFWVSTTTHSPQGPGSATAQGFQNAIQYLHIWAQPTTENGGPYHALDNPFKVLQNLSLDLVPQVGSQAVIDFLDDSFVVHNPQVNEIDRFQFVNDSTENSVAVLESAAGEADVLAGTVDSLVGLQGFSIDSGGGFGGPGASCDPPLCAIAGGNDAPAWRVVTVGYKTVKNSGSASYYLQIGGNGMNHALNDQFEDSDQTDVLFGSDTTTAYNARNDRQVTFNADNTVEFMISAFDPNPGDYNSDGTVGAADYTVWRDTLESTTDLRANGDDTDDSTGKIDLADYDIWRSHYGMTVGNGTSLPGGSSHAVPEPNACFALFVFIAFGCMARHRAAPWCNIYLACH